MTGPAPGSARALPVTLVGLRCSGKTSVGRALARALDGVFVDLDEALAERWSREQPRVGAGPEAGAASAGEVLAQIGIAAFRDLEERCLADVLDAGEVQVLATGGGAIERSSNRARLARTRCVWLDAPVEILAARQRCDPTLRPPLLGAEAGSGEPTRDLAAEIAALAQARRALYAEVAELRLDAGERSVAELVAEVLRRLADPETPENP